MKPEMTPELLTAERNMTDPQSAKNATASWAQQTALIKKDTVKIRVTKAIGALTRALDEARQLSLELGLRKIGRMLLVVLVSPGLAPQMARADFFDWLRDLTAQPGAQQQQYDPQPSQSRPRQVKRQQRTPHPQTQTRRESGGEADAISEFRLQPEKNLPMKVTRTEWTNDDEVAFGDFVARIGAAVASKKCNTVKKCMRSPEANIYADQDPQGLVLYSDCADFPYFLRAYFAYHNGLPFAYASAVDVSMRPYASAPDQDNLLQSRASHNSPYGNIIEARGGSNVPKAPGGARNLITYLENMFDNVSTRTYRVGALTPGFERSDLYPVKLNRDGIGPGTVVHSTGHALVVWKAESNGTIRVIDAHPDGSIQYKNVQPATLDRSRPDQGLGFFRFRPLRILGAKQASDGSYYGGKIASASDDELFDSGRWSLEQWFGPGSNIPPRASVDPHLWQTAFKQTHFFDYLAAQMRDRDLVLQADEIVGEMMTSLCDQMQQRVDDVVTAVRAGVPRMEHPDSIPADIFGEEDPVWGKYSMPGRDSRMRGAVGDIIKSAVGQFRSAKSGSKSIRFDGEATDYVAALRARVSDLDKTCVIKYTNSAGAAVKLRFTQILSRLSRMSFDPYHCPEKLWGASGDELKTCVDRDRGNKWYTAEQNLRNTTSKLTLNGSPSVRSDRPITLSMLKDPDLVDQPESAEISLGATAAPILNLDASFASDKFMQLLQQL